MFAHDRVCDLASLARLRSALPIRISWSVLFLKAYGLVAAEHSVLRRCYLKWPWPHLYEHPHSVATLVISRPLAGEDRLFWARFTSPETQSLVHLQRTLDQRYLGEPVESRFRRQILISRLPTPLRRMLWWTTLNLSGQKRAKRLGTFGLTTLAGEGAEIRRPPSPITTTLSYGPLDESGRMRVTIAYDHRVMDGLEIARALSRLEQVLLGPIAQEAQGLCEPRAVTPTQHNPDAPSKATRPSTLARASA